MANLRWLSFLVVGVVVTLLSPFAAAQLRTNYYASSCPSAESTLRSVISQHVQQSFAVAPGTLRLFFHDCFVRVSSYSLSHSGFWSPFRLCEMGEVTDWHWFLLCCRGATRR